MLLPVWLSATAGRLRCAAAGVLAMANAPAASEIAAAALKLLHLVTFSPILAIWCSGPCWSTASSTGRRQGVAGSGKPLRVAPVNIIIKSDRPAIGRRRQIGDEKRHDRRDWHDLLG